MVHARILLKSLHITLHFDWIPVGPPISLIPALVSTVRLLSFCSVFSFFHWRLWLLRGASSILYPNRFSLKDQFVNRIERLIWHMLRTNLDMYCECRSYIACILLHFAGA